MRKDDPFENGSFIANILEPILYIAIVCLVVFTIVKEVERADSCVVRADNTCR